MLKVIQVKIFHEFEAFYSKESEILILGSIPSSKSREEGFYYAHSQNRFWKVLAKVFNEEEPKTIDEKKRFLINNKIALWDVLASCEIKGSSDSSIKNPVFNDINKIINNSNIEKIFTTGKTAYNLYNKYLFSSTKKEAIYLPSTSPANCKMSLEDLVEEYKIIIK